jgi:uncharacterized protein (TIGR00369 family)
MTDAAPRSPYTDAELLDRFHKTKNRPPSTETLGFRVLRVDQAAGEVEAEFEGRPEFGNNTGVIQGGFLTAMLDEVTTIAGVVASGLTSAFPSLEMKTSYLRPCRQGKVRGVGRVVRLGRSVAFLEGDLYDAEGKHVAHATVTAVPTPLARPAKSAAASV